VSSARAPARRKDRPSPVGEISGDSSLFDRLRNLRKRLAHERDVPSFVIFPDTTLRQMAQDCPKTESDFARLNGVGERKLREYSKVFLQEIAAHLLVYQR
jgi:ATP-dependent DNA helicase RecQ